MEASSLLAVMNKAIESYYNVVSRIKARSTSYRRNYSACLACFVCVVSGNAGEEAGMFFLKEMRKSIFKKCWVSLGCERWGFGCEGWRGVKFYI